MSILFLYLFLFYVYLISILCLMLLDLLAGLAALGWLRAVLCWALGWAGVAGLLLAALCCSRLFLAPPGCSWLLRLSFAIPSRPFRRLAAPRVLLASWLLPGLLGCSLASLVGSWLLPGLAGRFGRGPLRQRTLQDCQICAHMLMPHHGSMGVVWKRLGNHICFPELVQPHFA